MRWGASEGHLNVASVKNLNERERSALLEAGYEYNETLEIGQLIDPYTQIDQDEAKNTAIFQAYKKLLAVSGSSAIGEVTYPDLGIGLPIYHGTSNEVISKGVGHMFGSSLPIGGPSTHAVLTSHSGLQNASLFTKLLNAKIDDVFWISVLSEDHFYQVRSVETVLPHETENLKIVDGEDWVTLFTCAPIGVNSHRFMVHAERIEAPDNSWVQEIKGDGIDAGFPWWLFWFLSASGVVAVIIFAPVRSKKAKK